MSAVDSFKPGGVGNHASGIYGLPHNEIEAKFVLIPIPWDVTTSYRTGTRKGPSIIRAASPQVDLYHPDFPLLWKDGVFMRETASWITENHEELRLNAEIVIKQLESGKPLEEKHQKPLAIVNEATARLNKWLKEESLKLMDKDKVVGVVGGDHGIPLGLMQACAEKHGKMTILHFDAHHDYREVYMGFNDSHASIMRNAGNTPGISLVQVGIRDYCQYEIDYIATNPERYKVFYDRKMKEDAFQGKTWHQQCEEIIDAINDDNVYVSFDIDGLAPHLCPGTGTPVPGGLLFDEATYLLKKVAEKKKIVGLDLVEVAGENDSIDAIIGARLLWNIIGYASISGK
jgi:agmatinase